MYRPLLPPWATDSEVSAAIDDMILEFRGYSEQIDHLASLHGPVLADEASAYLAHAAEGW